MIKGLFRLIIFVAILLALCFIFAPNLLSTKLGKAAFLKLYRSVTKNLLSVDTLELSWWKGQNLENLLWSDAHRQVSLAIPSVTTSATLWQILFYHDLGDLEVLSPKAILTMSSPLPTPLPKAQAGFIPEISFATSSTFKIPYYGQIHVKEGGLQFLNPGLPPIDLSHLHIDASLLKSQIQMTGSATTSKQDVAGHLEVSLLYLPPAAQIDLSMQLTQFPTRSLDQLLFLQDPSLQGSLVDAIGETLNVDLKLHHLPDTLSLVCLATAQNFSAKIETQAENGVATLASPATLQFQLPPALFQKLTSIAISEPFSADLKMDRLWIPLDNQKALSFQATLQAQVSPTFLGKQEPFSLFLSTDNFQSRHFTLKLDHTQLQVNSSLDLPSLDQIRLKGEALFANQTHVDFSVDTLSKIAAHIRGQKLQGDIIGSYHPTSGQVATKFTVEPFRFQEIPFSSTSGSLTANLLKQQGSFVISSAVSEGSLQATGHFSDFQNGSARCLLTQIPTTLAHLFFPNAPPLESLIGPTVGATIDVTYGPQKQQFSGTVTSQNLKATTSCLYTNSTLSSSTPTTLTFTLTPEGYAALDKWLNPVPTPLQLTEPATIQATLSSFSFAPSQPLAALYQANLSIDTLAFLNQIQIDLSHLSPTAPITFQFNARPPQGTATMSGSFDTSTGNTELHSQLDQFPSDTLDLVARAFGQSSLSFAALLGPRINLTAHTTLKQWSGPVNLELNTSQMRASLSGRVTDGILTLQDPFHLQMSLSRESSQSLSLPPITSLAPITLVIPPEGFSCPLNPFNTALINISAGRLELGKILCHNEGNLNEMMGLLKLSPSSNQDLQLWFAPLDFLMKQGHVECERTEILVASTYQICTWGDVDFTSRYVDMILGVTASCLKKAFGLEGLPASYVLQIPLHGPFNDVKIDSKGATGKITAIMLWQQRSNLGSIAGGKAGGLLGKFVDKAIPFPDSSKAPPPKHPFPWESGAPSKPKKNSAADPKKKRITADEAPLKQAAKLLR